MKRSKMLLVLALLSIFVLAACEKKNNITAAPTSPATSETPTQKPEDNKEPTGGAEFVKPENSAIYNISINPEVEFVVDENGIVTNVNYINADAQKYFGSTNMVGTQVEEASKAIVDYCIKNGLLKDEHGVTVALTDASKLSMNMYNQLIGIKEQVIDELSEQGRDDAYIEFDLSGHDPDEENCSLCHGALLITCDACGGKLYGNGKMHCDGCDTKGKLTCDLCNGSGKAEDKTCNRCDGSGQMTCNTCNGEGITECPRCHGELLKVCNRCNGTNVDQYINEKP